MNVATICKEIVDGTVTDEQLDQIRRAIEGRKEVIAAKMRVSLVVGQTVWFNDKVRPTYMQGKPAVVRKINRERIVVDLNQPCGRFHKGVTVPLTLVSAVEV